MFLHKLKTIKSLGLLNVLSVGVYRILKSVGFYRMATPVSAERWGMEFFVTDSTEPMANYSDVSVEKAEDLLSGRMSLFGQWTIVGNPPNWFRSCFSSKIFPNTDCHWSDLSDFDNEVGDIKGIWEISRFRWVLAFACAARRTGEARFIHAANRWLADWCNRNQINQGPNWMNGQEVAIRLVHSILADMIVRRQSPAGKDMERFVQAHCRRIGSTLIYAYGQCNNHIISESAGLYIGGNWLCRFGSSPNAKERGKKYVRIGKWLLESSVERLVMPDGTFSQYSTTYHRLLLDTLVITEWFRRRFNLSPFTSVFYDRAWNAVQWLNALVDKVSGEACNVGANDGAFVYGMHHQGQRDFRVSLQTASVVFCNEAIFDGDGAWNQQLVELDIPVARLRRNSAPVCKFMVGGFVRISSDQSDGSWGLLRIPKFRFRPSHADLLHFDMWYHGQNLLLDGGSYSYAKTSNESDYFAGIEGHNSCEFDGREPMPRLGRFLFSYWPVPYDEWMSPGSQISCAGAGYMTHSRARHYRRVTCDGRNWTIIDLLSGEFNSAKIRWRLSPDLEWSQVSFGVVSSLASIRVTAFGCDVSCKLTEGWESRLYSRKSKIPVFEINVSGTCHRVDTNIQLTEMSE